MWLDRAAQASLEGLDPEPRTTAVNGAYRRGILRAKVNVFELTCASARIDCMESLAPGTVIWLTLPGIEARQAIVEWSRNFSAGLRFVAPYHPAVLDAVLLGHTRRFH